MNAHQNNIYLTYEDAMWFRIELRQFLQQKWHCKKAGLKITAGQRSMTAEIGQMTADDGFPLFTLTVQKKRSSKQKIMTSSKDFKRNDIKI